MHELVIAAEAFAVRAHRSQARRFTGEPYVEHPIRVSRTVAAAGGTPEMVAAALLHDVLEDTDATYDQLTDQFGPVVAGYVKALTNEYTSSTYPELERRHRKKLERYRLSRSTYEVQTIKMADIADNTAGLATHDPKWAPLRLLELRELADALDLAHRDVRRLVDRALTREINILRYPSEEY